MRAGNAISITEWETIFKTFGTKRAHLRLIPCAARCGTKFERGKNMKKICAMLSALLLVLGLTACSGGDSAGNKDVNLADFYTSLNEKYEMPAMSEVTDDLMDTFYPGLKDVERTQTVLYMPLMNVQATEILLVQAADADGAKKVKEIFEQRQKDLDNQWQSYLPEQHELVKNAVFLEKGNYVGMVVSENADAIKTDFEALFK